MLSRVSGGRDAGSDIGPLRKTFPSTTATATLRKKRHPIRYLSANIWISVVVNHLGDGIRAIGRHSLRHKQVVAGRRLGQKEGDPLGRNVVAPCLNKNHLARSLGSLIGGHEHVYRKGLSFVSSALFQTTFGFSSLYFDRSPVNLCKVRVWPLKSRVCEVGPHSNSLPRKGSVKSFSYYNNMPYYRQVKFTQLLGYGYIGSSNHDDHIDRYGVAGHVRSYQMGRQLLVRCIIWQPLARKRAAWTIPPYSAIGRCRPASRFCATIGRQAWSDGRHRQYDFPRWQILPWREFPA